ncbi:MAG: hypothetical protein M3Q03_03195 [Chloroflexota bacterium]|nr:hypothetical protein [Chloroflexota bacterium]
MPTACYVVAQATRATSSSLGLKAPTAVHVVTVNQGLMSSATWPDTKLAKGF